MNRVLLCLLAALPARWLAVWAAWGRGSSAESCTAWGAGACMAGACADLCPWRLAPPAEVWPNVAGLSRSKASRSATLTCTCSASAPPVPARRRAALSSSPPPLRPSSGRCRWGRKRRRAPVPGTASSSPMERWKAACMGGRKDAGGQCGKGGLVVWWRGRRRGTIRSWRQEGGRQGRSWGRGTGSLGQAGYQLETLLQPQRASQGRSDSPRQAAGGRGRAAGGGGGPPEPSPTGVPWIAPARLHGSWHAACAQRARWHAPLCRQCRCPAAWRPRAPPTRCWR